jgi:hypothetical protein
MGKSAKEVDRYAVFIAGYHAEHNCYPIPAEIGRGLDVSRQAVRNYFNRNKETLEKIPEYKRYF